MKKFIFFVFAFFMLSFVSAQPSLNISDHPQSLVIFRNKNVSSFFRLTNTGNETITNINFSAILPEETKIWFYNQNITLPQNSSIIINFTLSASRNAGIGEKIVLISATGNEASTNFSFILKIKRGFCKYGEKGDLILDVEEPEEGDSFYVGEKILLEFSVENEGEEKDIVVEAELYDATENEIIEEDSLEDTLEEEEEKSYVLELKIPYDIEMHHEYIVYLKVYEEKNEDEHCKEKEIGVKIKKKLHSILIENKSFSKVMACGSHMDLILKIANTGRKDEKNVKVRVYNSEINFSAEQIKDIEEGGIESFFFYDIFPTVSPGKYIFTIHVSSEYISFYDNIEIELKENCKKEIKNVSIRTESITAFVGKESVLRLTLFNTGNTRTTYKIIVEKCEWANILSIFPESLEIDPGLEGTFLINFTPHENASLNNLLNVTIVYDSFTTTELININVKRETPPVPFWRSLLFELERNFVFIFIFALTIIFIILILLLFKKARRTKIKAKKQAKKGKASF